MQYWEMTLIDRACVKNSVAKLSKHTTFKVQLNGYIVIQRKIQIFDSKIKDKVILNFFKPFIDHRFHCLKNEEVLWSC